MGFDWPGSTFLFVVICILLSFVLWLHARSLLRSTLPRLAWKLIILRSVVVFLLLLLLLRPFFISENPDFSRLSMLTLTDLSGSMNTKDDPQGVSRIAQVTPFLDFEKKGSWIQRMHAKYARVDRFGFSEERTRWGIKSPEETTEGKKTALGEALQECLPQALSDFEIGSLVLFSDGLSNQGKPMLEVAKEYRSKGLPINVIGVGQEIVRGDLSISFTDRKPTAVAKEELLLSATLQNSFSRKISTEVLLMEGDQELEAISVTLESAESRKVSFSPVIPESAGAKRFRILLTSAKGDLDPSNDSDSLQVNVLPPPQISVLYLSNQVRPLYSFIKRSLGNEERFSFNALIRLGEKSFHAFGDKVKPKYPESSDFWMDFDTILLDLESLQEMNATVVDSLKDFVQKRGGGLLMFGSLGDARLQLGGVIPVKEVDRVFSKDSLSLRVFEEPLFGPKDEVKKMKPFMPDRLPGYFVSGQNKGARGVVVSKANGKAVLSVQAYGAGKAAYWGILHDWRRAIADEKGAKEFRKFWQSLVQWLGEGGEERLKLNEESDFLPRGKDAKISVEALGADFEPATDALVNAEVIGPNGFLESIQLHPEGAFPGQYSATFRPKLPGAYELKYKLTFPDGELLETETFLRVSETGEEAKDLSYAEKDLKMLAKLTGGQFLNIKEMNDDWIPTFSNAMPTIKQKASLGEFWVLFLLLFIAAGLEWIIRRQAGLR